MKIGIIGPTETEIAPFIHKIQIREKTTKSMLEINIGTYNNLDVVALSCGVCKVNAAIAAQLLIDVFNVTHVILTGVAGGVDQSLQIGDTVISTELAYHDVEDKILIKRHPYMKDIYFYSDQDLLNACKRVISNNSFHQQIYFGKIVTGESFVVIEGREHIKQKYEPLCVDMETASIAHVCYVNQVPFVAIRSISDTEAEHGVEVFHQNFDQVARISVDFLIKLLDEIKSSNT